MTRVPIAGAVLLVVLGAGLLIRVTDRAEVPPKTPDSPPVELRAIESQPVIETVASFISASSSSGARSAASNRPSK